MPYSMVGSLSSRMPERSRLVKTDATRGRSAATPVSFSTMEARIMASSGVRTTVAELRAAHRRARFSSRARRMRAMTEARVSPRLIS